MRKPEHSTESSIEEILASIRSIIAEDGATLKPSGQTQDYEPAVHSNETFEYAPVGEDVGFVSPRGNALVDQEQRAAQRDQTDDEILELTEDFMLPDTSDEHATTDHDVTAADLPANEIYSRTVSEEFGHAPIPEKEELDEVLSNLAAEVERLGGSDGEPSEPAQQDVVTEPLVENDAIESQFQPTETGAESFGALESAGSYNQTVGQPQITGLEEPRTTASPVKPSFPSYARQPVTPAANFKPVWSARKLETTEKSAKPASENEMAASQNNQEQSAAQPAPPAAQSSQPSVSRRDLWAEGFQMPVPDTGPEMPLPMSENDAEKAAKQEDPPQNETTFKEADRRAVGNFFSRVFGATPAPEQTDEPAADENALRAKAEKLVYDTISDFAEAKLNAPAVGNALKADEDFMNEVVSSLEDALASTNDELDAGSMGVSDHPESVSGEEQQPETQSDTERESGQDVKLIDALAVDANVGDEVAAEQEPGKDDEERSAAVAEMQITQHEDAAATVTETAQSNTTEEETILPESAGTVQVPAGDEITAERPPKVAEVTPEAPIETAANQPVPMLNLPANLDGSIKEMIKPLIIQWLNDNLPRIVEEAVREELADGTDTPEIGSRSRA